MDGMLQQQTAACFQMLAVRGICGPGTLSLCPLEFLPVPLAILGLGGACLLFSSDAAAARTAGRCGATDFTVDTLGEALRILKNELRQQRPVSVAVLGEPTDVLHEVLRRGVQPQTVFVHGAAASTEAELERRGAMAIAVESLVHGAVLLQVDCAETSLERRKADARLLHAATNALAERWLRIAPRLFPRDRNRVYFGAQSAALPGDTGRQEQG